MNIVINALAVALTCGVLAWASDLVRKLGFLLYTEQYIGAMVALALPLVFLSVPAGSQGGEREARRRSRDVPWYDIAAAAVGATAALYVAFRFPALSEESATRPWDGVIVAIALLFLFLEGLRRTSGIAITIVAVSFFCLALVGHLLPGALTGRHVEVERLNYFLLWDSSAVFGTPMQIITTVVVCFVFFGNALFKTGGSSFFTDISMALMGRFRGGPAKIAIMASSLFGTISGSVVANVVTTGVVTIPLMKRAGFRPQLAGAVEAVASTGGQLMPPVMGIAAFLMAEFLQVPYASVALAALLPAVLFYLALFVQADLEAAREGLRGVDAAQIPKAWAVLKSGWHFPIPFVVLIGALFWLNYEPETAALLATAAVIVASLVFGFNGKRLNLPDFYAILRDTGLTVIDLFMIGAAAGAVIACLNYSGLGFSLTLALVHMSGGNLIGLLVIAAVACIILGMGMPTVGVYILLATLVAPALIEMKIEPMAAHMFILYFGCLSMITPPVAIGAFAAANLAGADPMKTGFEAVRFGWIVFIIPFLFVFSGTLLMNGSPVMILIDFVVATVGVAFGAAGVMGYSIRPIGALERLVYVVAGLCLLTPLDAFGIGRWVNAVGAGMAIALIVRERMIRRRPAPAAQPPTGQSKAAAESTW
jgi:TRAP transporter 4TM/12TM fusion protein